MLIIRYNNQKSPRKFSVARFLNISPKSSFLSNDVYSQFRTAGMKTNKRCVVRNLKQTKGVNKGCILAGRLVHKIRLM